VFLYTTSHHQAANAFDEMAGKLERGRRAREYRRLIETANEGIWLLDGDLKFSYRENAPALPVFLSSRYS
jgi:PAS domain-containing protein